MARPAAKRRSTAKSAKRPAVKKQQRSLPLYQQVDNIIRRRLVDNVWKPGDALPSEMQLAAELDVSQGTVRKALNDLVAENLLYRRQGLGTFVSEHTERRALFFFFKIQGKDGSSSLPESELLDCKQTDPTKDEVKRLELEPGAKVVRFTRVRSFQNVPSIVEGIALPQELFPDFGIELQPPNNLFRFYQSIYGVTVAKARELITAVSATRKEAGLLGIKAGAPLLQIDRTSMTIDGRPVEWRVSRCNTSNHHYVSERG